MNTLLSDHRNCNVFSSRLQLVTFGTGWVLTWYMPVFKFLTCHGFYVLEGVIWVWILLLDHCNCNVIFLQVTACYIWHRMVWSVICQLLFKSWFFIVCSTYHGIYVLEGVFWAQILPQFQIKLTLMCIDTVESKYQLLDKCKLLFDLVVHQQQHLHCFWKHSSSFGKVWEKFHQM